MKSVVAILLLSASAAIAAPHQQLSFDELKMACKDPKRFQNQLQPTSIKLECSDKVLKYVPAGNGNMSLPAKRTVNYSVSSDKYTVPSANQNVKEESFVGECPVLKQIEETIAVSQDITCDQVMNYQGTATQLCVSLLDGVRKDNPAGIQTRETGKVASFCRSESGGSSEPSQPSEPTKPGKKPLK